MSFVDQVAGCINFFLFKERIANLVALRFQKGIGHATTDEQDINHVDEAFQHHDLVRDLGTANHCSEWAAWMLQGGSQEIDFLLHQEACHRWQVVGYALRRCMGTMGGTKGIVDVNVSKRG